MQVFQPLIEELQVFEAFCFGSGVLDDLLDFEFSIGEMVEQVAEVHAGAEVADILDGDLYRERGTLVVSCIHVRRAALGT